MIRGALLGLRIARFELLLAIGLLALTGISAVIALGHVAAADPGAGCWSTYWTDRGTDDRSRAACAGAIAAFWGAADEASFIASPVAVALPFVVGILLGVPIVGRELELRTAALAWSLSGDRRRWLLSRVVPAQIERAHV